MSIRIRVRASLFPRLLIATDIFRKAKRRQPSRFALGADVTVLFSQSFSLSVPVCNLPLITFPSNWLNFLVDFVSMSEGKKFSPNVQSVKTWKVENHNYSSGQWDVLRRLFLYASALPLHSGILIKSYNSSARAKEVYACLLRGTFCWVEIIIPPRLALLFTQLIYEHPFRMLIKLT